jgi:hypothetical protein
MSVVTETTAMRVRGATAREAVPWAHNAYNAGWLRSNMKRSPVPATTIETCVQRGALPTTAAYEPNERDIDYLRAKEEGS